MRKHFESNPWFFPLPVLIIGTYDENGKADAMNAAWGGLYDRDRQAGKSNNLLSLCNALRRPSYRISNIAFCLRAIICIQRPHPLPLLRQSRRLAEHPVLLVQPPQADAGGLGVLGQPRSLKGGFPALQLPRRALNLALLLGGLIVVILLALKLDFGPVLRLHGSQLGVGVGALGDALDVGPIGVAAVGPADAGDAAVTAGPLKIRVAASGGPRLRAPAVHLPCHAAWFSQPLGPSLFRAPRWAVTSTRSVSR